MFRMKKQEYKEQERHYYFFDYLFWLGEITWEHYHKVSFKQPRGSDMLWACIRMFGGFFFFWAFPWDGRALRFKSSPKGCGLYSAIPNAWLKTPLAGGVLLHTASCVLVMLLLNCRFFSVRVWHVCSLVGWLCFRYSDVIIRIFG